MYKQFLSAHCHKPFSVWTAVYKWQQNTDQVEKYNYTGPTRRKD